MSTQRAALPEMSRARSVRRASTVNGSVVSLSYPNEDMISEPTTDLGALTDQRSSYPSVMRSCLTINQFAGMEIPVMHDSSYARTITSLISALSQCLESHEDRRCRVLACKTVALVARSAYARIRHSPLLFATRDQTLNRLEDEVGTDIPVALCTAALEDTDDAVSATAVEALGMLTLSSSAMVGTVVDDELLRDMEAIAHVSPSPYAPSLSNLSDEDPSIPQMELQSRVFENVLTPRIWRLVRRILNYHQSSDILKTIPFMTSCLVHLIRINPSVTFGMDRSTYAKRWIEVDVPGLLYDFVMGIVIPSMKDSADGSLACAAALSGLRLSNVRPEAPWVGEVCRWASTTLVEQLAAMQVVEHKMGTLSTLLISLRALPLEERVSAMRVIINEVRFLPSTTTAAATITSPGIKIGSFYRRPARIGYLSEVALSFLVDGPSDADSRSEALKHFFDSSEVYALLASRSGPSKRNLRKWNSNNSLKSSLTRDDDGETIMGGGRTPTEEFLGSHVAEEFVLAFCHVASVVAEQLFSKTIDASSSKHWQDWLRCSVAILRTCSCCVNWQSRTMEDRLDEEDHDERTLFTMLTACQTAYVRLLNECFYAIGLLSAGSSVSLYLVPISTPPRILLLEDLGQAITSLARFQPLKGAEFMMGDVSKLADQFLEFTFRNRVPSRHIRIALIAAFVDHWVQDLSFQRIDELKFKDENARELLSLLSEEISTLILEMQNSEGINEFYLGYLQICVAAAENIALAAFDVRRRFEANSTNENFLRDLDEDVGFIISAARSVLRGINIREGANNMHKDEIGVLPICMEAIRRIDGTVLANNGYSDQQLIHSLIVTSAAHDYQMRMANLQPGEQCHFAPVLRSPLFDDLVEAPLVIDDSHVHAYYVHYCHQIIGSRLDLSLLSSRLMDLSAPVMDSDEDGVDVLGCFRSKNFLRLTPPPLPSERMPLFGTPLASRVNWGGSVTALSGGSDPISFVMAYSMRRCPRYDCEPEFRLMVSLRVHNLTAIQIDKGLRMDLRVTQQRSAFEAEGENVGVVLKSITANHKQEVRAGDQVTWEVAVDHWPMKGYIELHPSVTFREIDGEHVSPKLVYGDAPMEDDSRSGNESKEASKDSKSISKSTTTDDESTGSATGTDNTDGQSLDGTIVEEEDETLDIVLSSEPVQLSPMLGMQPCPLVFFKDGRGDVSTFRFLWYQMPHRMPEMMLFPNQLPGRLIGSNIDDFGAAVAGLSTIPIDEFIEGIGIVTLGWAFMTLKGDRMMCIMIESVELDEAGIESRMATLHFRADNEALLYSIMGSDSTRAVVVNSLTGDQWTSDDQMNGLLGL